MIIAIILWIGIGLRCWFYETILMNEYRFAKKCITMADLLSIPAYMVLGVFFSIVDLLGKFSKIVIWKEKKND
jgi:hypothetical protein